MSDLIVDGCNPSNWDAPGVAVKASFAPVLVALRDGQVVALLRSADVAAALRG